MINNDDYYYGPGITITVGVVTLALLYCIYKLCHARLNRPQIILPVSQPNAEVTPLISRVSTIGLYSSNPVREPLQALRSPSQQQARETVLLLVERDNDSQSFHNQLAPGRSSRNY